MLKIVGIIYLFSTVVLNTGVSADTAETDDELRKRLLSGYDKTLPPVLFSTGQHYSFCALNVLRIRGVDEKKGEFIVEGPVVVVWQDQRLVVESETILRVSSEDIWIPALQVHNRIEPDELTVDPYPVVVFGDVFWYPRYTLRTGCDLNLRYYPFDTQVCDVIVSYDSHEGDYLPTNISGPTIIKNSYLYTSFMLENPMWTLKSKSIFTELMNIDSDTQKEVIVFRFTIERSMSLIALGILTPCISCILLILTTYWMPAGSSLRSGISVISLIVSSSSLFTLGKILPATGSSTPIIVEYVSVTLILSTVTSIQAMVASILRRCQLTPPVPYTTIILKIPRLCLLLLGISSWKILDNQLDENFLFSELDDPENRIVSENGNNTENLHHTSQLQPVQSLWLKHIVLFDRVMFYVHGVVIVLFIVSVIITE